MSHRRLFLLAVATLVVGGCGKAERPAIYPVEGIVLANGEPAANANVAFYALDPAANPRCPVARTDGHGRFQLTTRAHADGAPPGDYAVTILWPDPAIEVDACECPDPITHDLLQGLYARANESDIHVTVAATKNSFEFNVWRPRGLETLR